MPSRSPSPTISDSELLDSLEDDPRFDLSTHREQRIQELSKEIKKIQALKESDYGRVITYTQEKDLIERMSSVFTIDFKHFSPLPLSSSGSPPLVQNEGILDWIGLD